MVEGGIGGGAIPPETGAGESFSSLHFFGSLNPLSFSPGKTIAHWKIPMNESRNANAQAYWKENIRMVLLLLAIWFVVSYGMGILFADALDQFRFLGFRLGFWMAQQGSIFCFVILIFTYVYKMNKLDHKYGVDEDKDDYVPDEDYYHPEDESRD